MTVQVRRIAPDDGERLRRVRLAALADAPGSFWQTLAGESARPAEGWRARAVRNSAGDAHATFLLERDTSVRRGGPVLGAPERGAPERGASVLGGPAADDDGPVGMVDVYQPSLAPEFRELAAMWVAPSVRGTGAADVLLNAAVDWAREVGAIGVRLWVVPTNPAAVRTYARHGFEVVGDPVGGNTRGGATRGGDTGGGNTRGGDTGGKVYVPMLLVLDDAAAASATFLARALASWTDESG